MKLCRYGKNGYEKPGIIDSEGRLRDLSKIVESIGPNEISPRGLKMLTKVKPETLPLVANHPRLGVPYVGIGKFVAIGLNYSDHAKEAGQPIPSEPVVFMKATTCINGPNDDIIQPRRSTKLDWEVELGVVIGTKAQYVSEDKALEHVAGYCVINDVSERSFQMATSQWDKGKGFDTSGPIGPWLVTPDEQTMVLPNVWDKPILDRPTIVPITSQSLGEKLLLVQQPGDDHDQLQLPVTVQGAALSCSCFARSVRVR